MDIFPKDLQVQIHSNLIITFNEESKFIGDKYIYVYFLYDYIPGGEDIIRYIGISNNPKYRLVQHIIDNKTKATKKLNWIRNKINNNQQIRLHLKERCNDRKVALAFEQYYIEMHKETLYNSIQEINRINTKHKIVIDI